MLYSITMRSLVFGLTIALLTWVGGSGLQAQDIPQMDLKEVKERIYQKNDTTYIVNFWATWCTPCVAEMPYFENFREKYADEKVQVILVSLDFDRMYESRLIPFVKERELKSEVIHFTTDITPNDWIPQFSDKWSGSIPATLVLNGANGVNDFYEQSFHSTKEIEGIYKKAVK